MRTLFLVITLHWKQFGRIIVEIGLPRFVLIGTVMGYALFQILGLIFSGSASIWLTVLLLISILSIQLQRNDKRFLQVAHIPSWPIFMGEYLLLSAPFWICFCLAGFWYDGIILIVGVALMAVIPGNLKIRKPQKYFAIPLLPTYNFEWKNGLRANPIGFLLLLISGFVYLHPAFALISLYGLAVYFTGFYMDAEPKELVLLSGNNPTGFLFKKIRQQLSTASLFQLPGLLVVLYFFTHLWMFSLYLWVAGMILQSLAICLKYSFYNPLSLERVNPLVVYVMIGFMIIPFLAPVPLFMVIRYFRKAKNNLTPLFHVAH